ncbi:MAG: threonine ammonia-lyase [Candidatus Saccharimonadales bacterium]
MRELYTPQQEILSPAEWRLFAERHVHEVAKVTPVEFSETTPTGVDIYAKREDQQEVGSFKLRGAYVRARHLRETDPNRFHRGLVAASAGNHAQGVALAAAELGTTATIFMPEGTPEVKIRAVKALGAEIVIIGSAVDESLAAAKQYAFDAGAAFIHPFDDEAVIAGQGTIGTELIQQLPDVDTIMVQIGGGGKIAGIARAVKAVRPDARIIGVQMDGCDSAAQSREQGRIVRLDTVDKTADGVAVKEVGKIPFQTIRNPKFVEGIVRVTPAELGRAIKRLPYRVEPAGALGYAGVLKLTENADLVKNMNIKTCATIISGCNADPNRINYLLEIAGCQDTSGK